MPPVDELLHSFRRIASDGFALAVFWHAFVAAGAVALMHGHVSERRAAEMLCLLLASVSGVAFGFGNVFNGVVIGVLTLALGFFARGLSRDSVRPGAQWACAAGVSLMAFGWAYPEFLDEPLTSLYGAPLGLLPCPTLAFLIGATFLFDGLGSRGWSLLLAAAGLFYGLFGALRLGVHVDFALAAGAAALGAAMVRRRWIVDTVH